MTYFTPTEIPRHSSGRSAGINDNLTAVAAGFAMLPTEAELKQGKVTLAGTDTGATDAYVVSLPYTPVSYTSGLSFTFVPANTNDSTATINVNSIGVAQIRNYAGQALSGGELLAGSPTILWYDATNGYFRIINPIVSIGTVTVNNNAKVTSADTTPGPLNTKQTAAVNGGLSKTVTSPAGDERLEWSLDASNLAVVAAADTADYVVVYDTSGSVTGKQLRSTFLDFASDAQAKAGSSTSNPITPANLSAVIAFILGVRGADITTGTVQVSAFTRRRVTAAATPQLPTMAAGEALIIEYGAPDGTLVTTDRNSQTIDGVASDVTCYVFGPIVLYTCTSVGIIKSELIGRLPQ